MSQRFFGRVGMVAGRDIIINGRRVGGGGFAGGIAMPQPLESLRLDGSGDDGNPSRRDVQCHGSGDIAFED